MESPKGLSLEGSLVINIYIYIYIYIVFTSIPVWTYTESSYGKISHSEWLNLGLETSLKHLNIPLT